MIFAICVSVSQLSVTGCVPSRTEGPICGNTIVAYPASSVFKAISTEYKLGGTKLAQHVKNNEVPYWDHARE